MDIDSQIEAILTEVKNLPTFRTHIEKTPLFLGRYTKIERLSRNERSVITLLKGEEEKQFVAKTFRLNRQNKSLGPTKEPLPAQKAITEFRIHSMAQHPYILPLIEAVYVPEKKKLHLILPRKEQNPLNPFLEVSSPLSDRNLLLRKFIYQISSALLYLKSRNITHRDVKLDNVLFDRKTNSFLLFDFSEAMEVASPDFLVHGSSGCVLFMAPECLRSKSPSGFNSIASDLWALGVCIFAIIFRDLPFRADNGLVGLFEEIASRQLKVDKLIARREEVDEKFVHLMLRMLERDVEKRVTLEEITSMSWLNDES